MTCLPLIPATLLAWFLQVNGDLPVQQQENLCSQIRAESLWDPSAVSHANARGLAQFVRPTWGDEGPKAGCPDWIQAFDAVCNMRAQRVYMRALLRSRIAQGTDPAERWAFAYASYNAGLGHIRKERRLCAGPLHPECDPTRWFGHVETTCRRNRSACEETRTYVRRITRFGARETGVLP